MHPKRLAKSKINEIKLALLEGEWIGPEVIDQR